MDEGPRTDGSLRRTTPPNSALDSRRPPRFFGNEVGALASPDLRAGGAHTAVLLGSAFSHRRTSRKGGGGVPQRRLRARLLGIERAAFVQGVEIDESGALVVSVRRTARELDRCGICGRRSPGFDLGDDRRRWRTLDVGTTFAYLEAGAPRSRPPGSHSGRPRST
jgi:hypothetical protein